MTEGHQTFDGRRGLVPRLATWTSVLVLAVVLVMWLINASASGHWLLTDADSDRTISLRVGATVDVSLPYFRPAPPMPDPGDNRWLVIKYPNNLSLSSTSTPGGGEGGNWVFHEVWHFTVTGKGKDSLILYHRKTDEQPEQTVTLTFATR